MEEMHDIHREGARSKKGQVTSSDVLKPTIS